MPEDRPHKSKAALDKLTPSEQEAVYERIESSTLTKAAKYIADEYGLALSDQAISQWAMKMRFKKNLEARIQVIVRARDSADILMQSVGDSSSIDKANLALLGQSFMDAQLTGNPATFKQFAETYIFLMDSVAKNKRADAAVQDSNTARRKFEFDAASAVLKNLDQLNAIRQSNAPDTEKQAAVVERLFGKPPEDA